MSEPKPSPDESRSWVFFQRPDRTWWRTWGIWVGVCVVGLIVTALCLPPPVPKVIRIAAGAKGGGYDIFARALGTELAKDGFRVEVVETAGSVENLQRLEARNVDVALVQGGTVTPGRDDLRSVCSAFFEPVWLLHAARLTLRDLRDLRGHRVAVGAKGSGTRVLALALLQANGLGPTDVELRDAGGEAAARAVADGEIDAAFAVLSARAPWLVDALAQPGVRVFDCARSESYARRWSYLHALTVSPGLLDLARDLPPSPTRVVAPAASLVFHPDSHRGLVPPLIEAVRRLEERDALFAPAGTFPSPSYVDAPLDGDARRYLEQGPSFLYRVFPISIAQVLDRLKLFLIPLLTLLIPIFKFAPPLYRWRMRARIYRWYRILREAEELLTGDAPPRDISEEIAKLDALEAEISGVAVPLSYADELYNLHLHVDYVRNKLRARLAQG